MSLEGLRQAAVALFLPSLLSACQIGVGDIVNEQSATAQKDVENALNELLGAASRRDFARLEAMHLYGPKFSKWDRRHPGRQDAEMTRREERAGLEPLDAFRPAVESLKVDVFGRTAVATFIMPYEVVAGGQSGKATMRATLVWVKTDAGWRVAHEHFSQFPDAQYGP
jgi:ketosteroid isomerase-like protein